jgi:hypothetical protein
LVEGQQNFKFDGVNNYLSSYSGGSVSSNTTVITIPESSGNSGFFDYFVSDGTNARAGTVIGVWVGSSAQYTDYSTPDIGVGGTTGISFTVSADGTTVSLIAVVTSGTWTVKVGSRVIF